MNNTFETARVIQVNRGQYTVSLRGEAYTAQLSGRLQYQDIYPVIGDYVEVVDLGGHEALIQQLRERTSYLSRPDGGGHADSYVKNYGEQAMAANLDYLFIITSLNDDFSVNRIVRFAAASIKGGCKPVVVLTKADLCPDKEAYLARAREISPELAVFAVSSYTGEGMDELRGFLQPGVTIGLMGSSGVGKSTLINTLAGREVMKVSAIREKDDKGRHTTTHRQLLEIDGVSFIDTPGMREFGLCDVDEGINETFSDIAALVSQCRFSDCSHTREPGCAIRGALANGSLPEERWALYRSLLSESGRARALSAEKKLTIQKEKNDLKTARKAGLFRKS